MQHLYKIIGRLTPTQISQYDFLMNFGVSIDSKSNLKKAVDSACDYNDFKYYIQEIPFKEVLMIHKYFTFAVKKIKVIMYAEQLDQVSDDFLKEIDDKDEEGSSDPKTVSKKRKEPKKEVRANKKQDKLKDGKP